MDFRIDLGGSGKGENTRSAAMKSRVISFLCGAIAAGIATWLALSFRPRPRLVPAQPQREAPLRIEGQDSTGFQDLAKLTASPEAPMEERLEAAIALAGILPADVPKVCEKALTLAKGDREAVLKALLMRWAESDGPAAMKWGRDHLFGQKEWMQCFLNLGAVWASCDPAGLERWINSEGKQGKWAPSGQGLTGVDWLARADVVAAARLAVMEEGHTSDWISKKLQFGIRTSAQAREIAARLKNHPWTPPQPQTMEGGRVWFPAVKQGYAAAQVAKALEARWPEIDPAGWAAWIIKNPIATSGRPHVLEQALQSHAANPSPALASAAVAASPPELLEDTTARLIGQWAFTDPESAGTWLNEQRVGGAMVQAVEAYAWKALRADPVAAFAWLAVLPDEHHRERLILSQFKSWQESQPVAATEFLKTADWPAERLERLRLLNLEHMSHEYDGTALPPLTAIAPFETDVLIRLE